ncbi:MAG: C25 family cysteine peptidase, partial [Candidatus Zixiibacteriota bacterium]
MVTFLAVSLSSASAYELILGQGEEAEVTLLSSGPSEVKVELNIPRILVEDKTAEGEIYQVISIPGGGILTQVGKPQVPLVCRFVALPPTSGVRVDVIEEQKEVLSQTFVLYPFQEPAKRSGDQEPEEFKLDEFLYSQNKAFPGRLAEAGEISILRDLRLAPIIFYPVQFNPQSGEVTVYKKIVVEIKFEGEGENPKLNTTNVLTRSFYKTYQRFVLNFDLIKQGLTVVDGSVLIITYDDFYSQVEPLAEWKHKRGLITHLVNLSEVGSSNTDIYNYIYDAYHNWPDPPEYVILVGDIQQIPTNYGIGGVLTDHKYTTVDGSDYFADVHIGRISVQTQAEANHVITKTLYYQKYPFLGETDWFLEGMTISGSDYVDDQNALRCGFLMIDYAGFTYFDSLFYSNGLCTAAQITDRLNDGRSWVVHFGHGTSTGWYPAGFTNSNIDALSNGEKLPAIVSVACSNGEFDVSGDCFAERWIKAGDIGAEKGAVIIVASTDLSAFFYSDTLARGTFISYFADSNFHFTAAVDEGKMYMYQHFPEGPGGNTEQEMQMYLTFGDPELDPWSGIPESLEVSHPDHVVLGGAPFPVTVNLGGQPVEDALVCLMKDTEIYEVGRTDSTGEVILYPSPLTLGDA